MKITRRGFSLALGAGVAMPAGRRTEHIILIDRGRSSFGSLSPSKSRRTTVTKAKNAGSRCATAATPMCSPSGSS